MTASFQPYDFYVAENPDFTILDSALASIRYALAVCDDPGDGTLRCRSVTSTPDGTLSRYRGRLLEGVGYCADSVFAANHLIRFGRILGNDQLSFAGERLARHALSAGFFADAQLPVRMYRDCESGEFLDNLEGQPEYLDFGHMARVGYQLLALHELLDAQSASAIESTVRRLVTWLLEVDLCSNGWYPRRCTPTGRVYDRATDASSSVHLPGPFPHDPIYACSGAGSFVVQFLASVQRKGWIDLSVPISAAVEAFMAAKGHFGSTNTDTEDLRENVSYALGYLALEDAAEALSSPAWSVFARAYCLEPLAQFEICENLNGMETKGLHYLERTWPSACMWENAMAAQAYLVAHLRTHERSYAVKALTILRAMAKHHHGELGFLTEGVDWDGHAIKTRHFAGAAMGDINDTHPFLNNLYLLEPTLTYLSRIAYKLPEGDGSGEAFYDLEGNRLGPVNPVTA